MYVMYAYISLSLSLYIYIYMSNPRTARKSGPEREEASSTGTPGLPTNSIPTNIA